MRAGPEHEIYIHGHHPVVVTAHARRTAAEAAAFLLPSLRRGMRVIDIGCGPGSISVGLARAVDPGDVLGVDQSAEVLVRARERAAVEGVANIGFTAASAYALPAGDGEYDAAYAHQLLQHLADPVGALSEMFRVVKGGGLVAVRDADYGTMTHHPRDPLLDRWLEIYHEVARAGGGEPDAGRRLLSWVSAAGFAEPVATASTWLYADEAARVHWAELWAGRIGTAHFTDRAEELGVSTRSELEEIGAAFRSWADHPDGWFAFIHGEVLARRP